MRQRHGSMHAQAWGPALGIAERADGAARHRPRHHGGLSPEQEQVLQLQRLAGNDAVSRALADGRSQGLVTSVDAMELTRDGKDPEGGIKSIREQTSNKLAIALTQRGIRDDPPIMKPDPPRQTKNGWVSTAKRVDAVPEPMIKEFWPTKGLHKIADANYLYVEDDWARKLEKGEDEHASDAKLAWELTWKKVQTTINDLSKEPKTGEVDGPSAEKALWQRYLSALPKDLQPEGPSDAKQREILAVRPGTFFAWMWEITVARDGRMYHETKSVPTKAERHAPKDSIVQDIEGYPQFEVEKQKSDAFIDEIRKKYTPGKIIQGSKLKAGDATGKEG
jgi:hypothetical protein